MEAVKELKKENSGADVSAKVAVNRIRRITGYLTGDVRDSWNSAKQSELHDRTKNIGRVGFQQDKTLDV